MCVVLWIQIADNMYVRVTSEKAYILAYAHAYIHTSCALLTFIWICIRYNSSLGEYALIMCIIFCITFCIVAFNFAAICIFTCGPTWKLLTDISKLHRTHIHTYIQECKCQAYLDTHHTGECNTHHGRSGCRCRRRSGSGGCRRSRHPNSFKTFVIPYSVHIFTT